MNATTWASKAAGLLGRSTVVAACAIAPLAVWGQRIVDLGPTSQSAWTDINNAGQVAGFDAANGWVLLYSGGAVTTLWAGRAGSVSGLNDAGAVVGFVDVGGARHAAVFTSGRMEDLGTLGSGDRSQAVGINASGQVAGSSNVSPGSASPHAFLYTGGTMTDLGTLGGSYSTAYGINASGQVVGDTMLANGETHAYLYSDGRIRDIGTLGGPWSIAEAINEDGKVAGWSSTGRGGAHAFLYDSGRMTDLGTLAGMSGSFSAANDINSNGQVVGESGTPGADINHAFLYADGVMVDLNDYVGGSGWTLHEALAINDNGDILGRGTFGGVEHSFVLTQVGAVPEPGTYALMAIGMAGLLLVRRRRAGDAAR